jgi:enediyne biosynthesis protein E4
MLVGVALVLGGVSGARDAMHLSDVSDRLAGFQRPNGPQNAGALAGVAWFDYNNDGRLDLFIPNNKGRPHALFRNRGRGRFVNVAAKAGVADRGGGGGAAAADINNDGCQELLVSGNRGVEIGDQSPVKLYLNRCNGTFKDITESSKVRGTQTSMPVAFGDVNNDGLLDIFLASAGDFKTNKHPNKLYLNNGDLSFTDISARARIERNQGSTAVSFTDYNKDGLQDIMVPDGNEGLRQPLKGGSPAGFQPIPTPQRLYRNNGDLTFTNVAPLNGLFVLGFWMAVALGDYDNDSDLDYFDTNVGRVPSGPPGEDVPPLAEIPGSREFPHGFWENQQSRLLGVVYKYRPREAGLRNLNWGWGASFADFDNDGWEDLFFNGTYPGLGGILHNAALMGDDFGNPGYLLRNNSKKRFELVQTFGQQDRLNSGSAVADFDNDGFPDVAVATTAFGDDEGAPILLRNETANDNGWITVRLIGTKSNRDGIGAKVRVLAGRLTKLKEVRSGSSFLSMDSPWLTFGLGPNAPATVPVEVTWPSGLVETFHPTTRRIVTLQEGSSGLLPVRVRATCRSARVRPPRSRVTCRLRFENLPSGRVRARLSRRRVTYARGSARIRRGRAVVRMRTSRPLRRGRYRLTLVIRDPLGRTQVTRSRVLVTSRRS